MAVKVKASIRLNLCNPKQLATTVAALKPEVNSSVTHRANVDLQVHDCFLVLIIVAEDIIALRAMTNAYLRWIMSTVKVVEVIKHM
ncbi:MAG: hypothetical protein LBE70_03385 [Nitrososphaerota archaeon]|jgi:tRNA threonylcarbamoyladenosine modification (KEOPS) complex  Pcc1 subunit|nr:hypothetical protein [Nitrososphaerota archaeon]